jgi:hypothetical protein
MLFTSLSYTLLYNQKQSNATLQVKRLYRSSALELDRYEAADMDATVSL